MAGKPATISSAPTRINAFQIQRSAYGTPIPLLLGGTNRIAASLLWYNGFKSVAETSTTKSGGKGAGGAKQKNTTYTYFASIILGICEGPIGAVTSVFRDKSSFVDGATTALAQAGLSLKTGEAGQSVWPYLTTNFPDQALAYTQTAYAYAADYELNANAGLQNHTFEVVSLNRVAGLPDANPRDLVVSFLTDPNYGVPGWTAALLGDLDDFASYCLAANLLLSPLLDEQRPGSQVLSDLVMAANSEIYWSEGKLKIKPYATQETTANGETWEPDLTPVYDLADRDFLTDDENEDPVTSSLKRPSDAYNYVQIEFLNRARQYNVETMPAFDQAAIEALGERKENPIRLHYICDADVAKAAAELRKNRVCYVRETFSFRLPWTFSLLEQMDLVTLTEARMGLDRKLVRITDIEEDEEGDFAVSAEEVLIGVADAPLYPTQGPDGYEGNYDAPPGNVSDPIIFTPPSTLTEGRLEIWAAVTGLDPDWGGCEMWVSLDDATYQRVGAIYGGARYGETTTALPTNVSPDETNTLGVDLTASAGELLPATQAEVDAAATLCYIGGELIAYRDATLTGSSTYDLDYLLRGLNGSAIATHAPGEIFVRLDEAVFRYAFLPEQVGETVYIKFRSFNIFTRALQDLADLTPYTTVLSAPGALPDPVAGLVRQNPSTEADVVFIWEVSARATSYNIFIYSPDGATFYRSAVVTTTTFTYGASEQASDGSTAGFLFVVVASNAFGDATASGFVITAAGGGPGGSQPAAVTLPYGYSPGYNTFVTTCDPSPDPLTTGYALYTDLSSGFTPTGAPTGYSAFPSVAVYAYTGFVYGRIAAFNADWSGDPADLNFAAETGAFVYDYREDCPTPDTMILMADGSEKAAGDLVPGDLVRTKDETSREWMDACVMAASPGRGLLYTVVFDDAVEVTASRDHRLGLVGAGFRRVADLIPGVTVDGVVPRVVASVTEIGPGAVVHLTVGEAKTYVTNGVLSHNIKQIDLPAY